MLHKDSFIKIPIGVLMGHCDSAPSNSEPLFLTYYNTFKVNQYIYCINNLFLLIEVSMRASRAVSWANYILHVHFKSINHNH